LPGSAQALAQQRWPEGFRCPRCGHDHGYAITTRRSYECSKCHYQASLTAGTLFHSTNLSLIKWFWAIYLAVSDKGGISAMRLSKQIGVSWISSNRPSVVNSNNHLNDRIVALRMRSPNRPFAPPSCSKMSTEHYHSLAYTNQNMRDYQMIMCDCRSCSLGIY